MATCVASDGVSIRTEYTRDDHNRYHGSAGSPSAGPWLLARKYLVFRAQIGVGVRWDGMFSWNPHPQPSVQAAILPNLTYMPKYLAITNLPIN